MLVGITGAIGSGKNTVANYLVQKAGYEQDSFAASLKDVCSVVFAWDRDMMEGATEQSRVWREQVDEWWEDKLRITGFSPRMAMQLVGTDTFRNHFSTDIWLLTVQRRHQMRKSRENVVITDARFPNEINMIKELGGKIVNVTKEERPEWYSIAEEAMAGCVHAEHKMKTVYRHIHTSEWAWMASDADYVISNTGTKEELEKKVWGIHLQLAGVK